MPSKTKQRTLATRPLTKSEKVQLKGKGGSAPSPVKTLSNMYKGAKRAYNYLKS